MRTLFHLRWLLALLLAGPLAARASHLLGGDIAYRPVTATTAGVPRYHVTIRLFTNPAGYQQDFISLLVSRGGCGNAGATGFTVPNIPRSSNTPGTWVSCSSPAAAYYEASLYETDVDLPAGQWTLAVLGTNRVDGVQNLPGPAGHGLYLSAYLDNTLTTQDASPTFLSNTLPLLSAPGSQRFSFSAFDADGDSLAYAFVPVREYPGGESAWTPTTCPTDLAGSLSPHFDLSASTGELTRLAGSSTQTGFFAMAARVSAYRRLGGQWQLVGATTRDILYIVLTASNQPPTFTSVSVNGGPAQALDVPIVAPPGQTVQLLLTASDPDAGQQLSFSSSAAAVVPGLSFTTVSATQARLTWQVPATLPKGRASLPLTVRDNGCPYSAAEDRTLTFVVGNRALAAAAGAGRTLGSAWPTPFREQVQFAAPAGQPVLVLDVRGREVAHLLAGPDGLVRWLPTPALAPGLYLARAADGAPLARLLRGE